MNDVFIEIKEEYGFEGLQIDIVSDMYENAHITLSQMTTIGDLYCLGSILTSKRCISAKDIRDILIKKYSDKTIVTKTNIAFSIYTEITVIDKRQEALDWIKSIALIHQLANC